MARAGPSASLRLHLLGRFGLAQDDQPIQLPTRKAESLLAYLAQHPGEHAREKIAALFWGESPDEDARRSLRVALAALRKVLGDDALLADRETILLNPEWPLWVDALEFKSLISNLLRPSEVLDLLTRLVDKSLVNVETPPGEGARYQMLETLWEYAREKLAEAGELAELQDRRLAYYAEWMKQAAPRIQGPEQTLWIRRMEDEHPNLRAALDWAMSERAADPQAGFWLAAASGLFWLTPVS